MANYLIGNTIAEKKLFKLNRKYLVSKYIRYLNIKYYKNELETEWLIKLLENLDHEYIGRNGHQEIKDSWSIRLLKIEIWIRNLDWRLIWSLILSGIILKGL